MRRTITQTAPKRSKPYTKCSKCGKQVRVRCVGGDWLNAIYPYTHKDYKGQACDGSYKELSGYEIIFPGPF